MWVYLNWALGFRSLGCEVIWLEPVSLSTGKQELLGNVLLLKDKLKGYGLSENVALWCQDGSQEDLQELAGCISVHEAAQKSDVLINQYYTMSEDTVKLFRKTILLDIDPGLTQVWIANGHLNVAPHDIYFTIGETAGQSGSKFPDAGLKWLYTPPCVSLEEWHTYQSMDDSCYSTVTHWSRDSWEYADGILYPNGKQDGFSPFIDLPKYVSKRLELAVCLGIGEEEEQKSLEAHGWYILESQVVTSTPARYHHYIQNSRGEFSCVKPSCIHLQNAWISDRTLCYLASGKPAIVQHTGESRFLPDSCGLLRFRNFDEAIRCLEESEENYDKHCRSARTFTEEYFDAKKVANRLLERAI